jgi:GDPmannose 4,6-dehydratase
VTTLVTGVTGQDGVYLARALTAAGESVIGTALPGAASAARQAAYLSGVEVIDWDVRDSSRLPDLLDAVRPTRLFHLAGSSSIGESWRQPDLVTAVNDIAVGRLLEEVIAHRARTAGQVRVFVASSAAVAHDDSPYSLAKRAAEEHVATARSQGLFACSARLHNHESPLRERRFVTRKITAAAAEIATGRRESVSLGNLGVRRDWGHARDTVEAMRRMLDIDAPVDLEIGTGVAHSLTDLLSAAFAAAGLGDPAPYLREDAALVRPTDAAEQVADPEPARQALGWSATTTFEETIGHMVRVDLARLRSGVEESVDYL